MYSKYVKPSITLQIGLTFQPLLTCIFDNHLSSACTLSFVTLILFYIHFPICPVLRALFLMINPYISFLIGYPFPSFFSTNNFSTLSLTLPQITYMLMPLLSPYTHQKLISPLNQKRTAAGMTHQSSHINKHLQGK